MRKLFALITILSIVSITANVSHSAHSWGVTYDGGNDVVASARSIQQTTDGGYIVAGSGGTYSFDTGNHDFWILKLDSNGNVTWQKTYGGSENDWAYFIQQTTDGGYIVAGSTSSFGVINIDCWIMKLDSLGDVVWQKTYGYRANDSAYSIQQTTDGGYIVAGYSYFDYDVQQTSFLVMKLDINGDVIWQKAYDGYSFERAYSIQQTTDGGYIVGGYTSSFGAGTYDFWVMKLDINGDITWQKTYGGNDWDYAYSIQQTTDGGYIVAGYTKSFGSGSYDLWILKLDSSGDIIWQKTYGGNDGESAYSIQQTTDGGYIVAGYTSSFGAGNGDSWVLKLNSSGDIVWQKTYGGNEGERAYSIQQTTDGGYIVGGYTSSFGAGTNDFWILKLDSDGEIPDCSSIAISNASLSNTFVASQDSSAIIASPSIPISDTNIIPQNTTTEISVGCCYDTDDYDGDGTGDGCDNCPDNFNPNQEDTDGDVIGDLCDKCTDADRDGYGNPGFPNSTCPLDNCCDIPNPDQADTDGDGMGDVCDDDDDSDGILDENDNCPTVANLDQADSDSDGIGDACDDNPDDPDLPPTVDGHCFYELCCMMFCTICPPCEEDHYISDSVTIGRYSSQYDNYDCSARRTGIIEFDVSGIGGLFTSGQIEAILSLTVKDGDLSNDTCLSLYDVQDINENGTIEEVDVETEDYIGEICENLQPGDIITFDVTSAVEHDLFDPNQTAFSGFVLDRSTSWQDSIEFYDNTDIAHGPRLSISDGDGIFIDDNCPLKYNPDQEDTYPPQGNSIGDACDCEGDFDCDSDVDGTDAALFKSDFGSSTYDPCMELNVCHGDFGCDEDIDGTDAAIFKADFGRGGYNDPCPACEVGEWCSYP